ncbi:MAG: hypothetical protein NTV31_02645 [Bacteroidia bacterium]|nr:hypothetical protein [Bacteroidia bacterium]
MKRTIQYVFIFFFILSGCAVYTPQTVDIPLINKKNELRTDAGFSSKEFLYATLSYGLTNKIALQTFFNLCSDGRYFVHTAVGYFKEFGNRNVIEFYNGIGYGHTDYYLDGIPATLTGNYQLYFTQFNFGKISCQFANADFGVGIKVGYLHTHVTDYNYFTRYPNNYGPYETLIDKNFVFEPNAFLRIGGQKLKFSLKLGSCWNYQFTHRDKLLPFNKMNLGLGINYRF